MCLTQQHKTITLVRAQMDCLTHSTVGSYSFLDKKKIQGFFKDFQGHISHFSRTFGEV